MEPAREPSPIRDRVGLILFLDLVVSLLTTFGAFLTVADNLGAAWQGSVDLAKELGGLPLVYVTWMLVFGIRIAGSVGIALGASWGLAIGIVNSLVQLLLAPDAFSVPHSIRATAILDFQVALAAFLLVYCGFRLKSSDRAPAEEQPTKVEG